MTVYTAEQTQQRYVDAMGSELGRVFYNLYNECSWLHAKWQEYVELFGKTEVRVDLLNRAAQGFFGSVQEMSWEAVLLHLCRITDRATVSGRATLTVHQLPALVDEAFRPTLKQHLARVEEKTAFARDWRNRHISHRDLDLALDRSVTQLAEASRQHVYDAIRAVDDLLNGVELHYCPNAPVGYDFIAPMVGDAETLLYLLRDALDAADERLERLKAGKASPTDFVRRGRL